MSPLLHKSMTWAIVSSCVLTSAWLANSVQDKHERRGFRFRIAEQAPVPGSAATTAAVQAQQAPAKIQVAAIKR